MVLCSCFVSFICVVHYPLDQHVVPIEIFCHAIPIPSGFSPVGVGVSSKYTARRDLTGTKDSGVELLCILLLPNSLLNNNGATTALSSPRFSGSFVFLSFHPRAGILLSCSVVQLKNSPRPQLQPPNAKYSIKILLPRNFIYIPIESALLRPQNLLKVSLSRPATTPDRSISSATPTDESCLTKRTCENKQKQRDLRSSSGSGLGWSGLA